MLTVLGVVIGLTALVATLGLSRTAGNRIVSQFDQVAATELFVTAKPGITGSRRSQGHSLGRGKPFASAQWRGRGRNVSEVDVGNALVSASPVKDP